jgi:plastocyanin
MIRHARNTAAVRAAAVVCVLCLGALQSGLAASAAHTVVMEGIAFTPNVLTVAKGDSIVWVNKDAFPHTATAQDKSFDSKEIAAGKTWRFTARKAGTFPYVCTLHPTMKGTLIVK